ncbi:hypothetical protein [Streptomyces sp. enrichment culture]|uniref:hypothetical protein n=1 Tax=Streptomyces sp. enrichment culture TaxID=1795815 RepID=UPI003F55F687
MLNWARTGVETPRYASMDARAAEIEAGAGRPVADLVAGVLDSAARFEEAVRAPPPLRHPLRRAGGCAPNARSGAVRAPGSPGR